LIGFSLARGLSGCPRRLLGLLGSELRFDTRILGTAAIL
jgi:hypothetical protein